MFERVVKNLHMRHRQMLTIFVAMLVLCALTIVYVDYRIEKLTKKLLNASAENAMPQKKGNELTAENTKRQTKIKEQTARNESPSKESRPLRVQTEYAERSNLRRTTWGRYTSLSDLVRRLPKRCPTREQIIWLNSKLKNEDAPFRYRARTRYTSFEAEFESIRIRNFFDSDYASLTVKIAPDTFSFLTRNDRITLYMTGYDLRKLRGLKKGQRLHIRAGFTVLPFANNSFDDRHFRTEFILGEVQKLATTHTQNFDAPHKYISWSTPNDSNSQSPLDIAEIIRIRDLPSDPPAFFHKPSDEAKKLRSAISSIQGARIDMRLAVADKFVLRSIDNHVLEVLTLVTRLSDSELEPELDLDLNYDSESSKPRWSFEFLVLANPAPNKLSRDLKIGQTVDVTGTIRIRAIERPRTSSLIDSHYKILSDIESASVR